MFSIKFNAFLLAFVAISCGQCLATYQNYRIGSEFWCNSEIEIKENEFNTSIVLESSELMPERCAIRISGAPQIDGLIVSVHNLSISNNLNKSCDQNIEFDFSPIIQWCDSSEAKTLTFGKSSLDIVFNSGSKENFYFTLVVTPFEKPVSGQKCLNSVPFSCQSSKPLNCISEAFICDGIENCPDGTDENNCTHISNPEFTYNSESKQQLTKNSEKSGYNTYNLSDFCNKTAHLIEFKSESNEGNIPAILELSAEDSKRLHKSNCFVRFSATELLVIGIDYISIANNNNKSCDDFIQISSKNSNLTWCSNKTDDVGVSFKEIDDIDFVFHAGSDSNSSFRLIITPYKKPIKLFTTEWCVSPSDLKCSTSGNQCVSKQFKCDHRNNCPNAEDEINCHFGPTTPTPTTTTTSPNTTTTTTPKTTTTTPTTTTAPTTTTTTAKTTTTLKPTSTTKVPITTTSAPSPSPSPSPSPPNHMSAGIIALIVIGTLVAVFLVGLGVYKCIKRRAANTGYNALN